MKNDPAQKQSSIRKRIYVFWSVIISFAAFSFWPTTYAAAPTSPMAPVAVKQYAEQQAQALGTSHSDWLAAKLHYYPLGPGTHGWFVQASISDKRVGYMIISVTSQGQLMLTEYGQGEQTLYDNALLEQALERLHLKQAMVHGADGEISAHYAPPLLAYWKLERPNQDTVYLDASNGDLLPAEPLQRLENKAQSPSWSFGEELGPQNMSDVTIVRTDHVHMHPAVDPSLQLAWLTSEPLQPARIQSWLQHNEHASLVFSAGERNLFYGGPLPVSGHQQWHTEGADSENTGDSGNAVEADFGFYVALGGIHSVQRFVPLSTLRMDGHFYIVNP